MLCVVIATLFYQRPVPTKWSGFYYAFSDDGNRGSSAKFNIKAPTNRSQLNAFSSLEECDQWAINTRRTIVHRANDAEDLYYCAKGCTGAWSNGIDCLDPTGVLTSFR